MRSILAVAILLLAGLWHGSPATAQNMMGMSTWPLYGNWCGPDHPGNPWRATLPPVDPLDAACRRHDLCYRQRGTMDCACDLVLMNDLRRLNYPTESIAAKARAMYDMLAMIPCQNPLGTSVKQSLFWNELIVDTLTGRASPMEMPFRFGYLGMETIARKLGLKHTP